MYDIKHIYYTEHTYMYKSFHHHRRAKLSMVPETRPKYGALPYWYVTYDICVLFYIIHVSYDIYNIPGYTSWCMVLVYVVGCI